MKLPDVILTGRKPGSHRNSREVFTADGRRVVTAVRNGVFTCTLVRPLPDSFAALLRKEWGYPNALRGRKDKMKTICHTDGSVSFWSQLTRKYLSRVYSVASYDLAAMTCGERSRVQNHLEKHRREVERIAIDYAP